MSKMQGIVLRVEEQHVVVITNEGDFLKLKMPARRPLPGERIEIPAKKRVNFLPYYAAAAILIFLMAFGVFKPFATTPALASVALDMTPSLELIIGKGNLVIEAQAQNAEGEDLLKELNLNGIEVYQAVNLITAKAAEMNYFDPENKNLAIATVIPLQTNNETGIDEKKIMEVIHDEMYKQKYSGYVVVNQAGKEIMKQAEESGLSVTKYMLQEKYKEQGAEVLPETLEKSSPTQMMQSNQMSLPQAFPGDWCEVSDPGWRDVNSNNSSNKHDNSPERINPTKPNDSQQFKEDNKSDWYPEETNPTKPSEPQQFEKDERSHWYPKEGNSPMDSNGTGTRSNWEEECADW